MKVRLFKVEFRPPTDHRGARVVVADMFFAKEKRILPYDYACGNILIQAHDFLKDHGMNVVFDSETKDAYYLAVDDFDCRIAAKRDNKTYAVTKQGSFEISNETK